MSETNGEGPSNRERVQFVPKPTGKPYWRLRLYNAIVHASLAKTMTAFTVIWVSGWNLSMWYAYGFDRPWNNFMWRIYKKEGKLSDEMIRKENASVAYLHSKFIKTQEDALWMIKGDPK
ncbi:unnamed protein product, partial [Mesorhabditis belari]|uniref:Uncharacterized protein n=1 Tax=Mesorhabditis belari TaxID=2138241 RepID=A0AAF3J6X3_9BILA